MWILWYESGQIGEPIEVGPNYINNDDKRTGWETYEQADQERWQLNEIYKEIGRVYQGPLKVPDDYILYNGC